MKDYFDKLCYLVSAVQFKTFIFPLYVFSNRDFANFQNLDYYYKYNINDCKKMYHIIYIYIYYDEMKSRHMF